MKLVDRAAESTKAALRECFDHVEQSTPWRWRCASGNGRKLEVAASLANDFLRLNTGPLAALDRPQGIDRAIAANARLDGGVKFAVDPQYGGLSACSDIAVLDEPHMRARLGWTLAGFQHADGMLDGDAESNVCGSTTEGVAATEVAVLLEQLSWNHSECRDDEWPVVLDADCAPPAKVRIANGRIVAGVELARVAPAAESARRALTLFLLTACGIMRLVRAVVSKLETQMVFRLEVVLPPSATPEEADHALAALSVAWRVCAREAPVLLDETAARLYLAAHNPSPTYQPLNEKEI